MLGGTFVIFIMNDVQFDRPCGSETVSTILQTPVAIGPEGFTNKLKFPKEKIPPDIAVGDYPLSAYVPASVS